MRKMFSQKQINELIKSGALVEIEKYIKANQEAGENPSTLSTIKIGDTIYVIPQKTDADIKALAKAEVEDAETGTIADALGLDENGGLVKGAVGGGTKLYQHVVTIDTSKVLTIISLKQSAFTSYYSDIIRSASNIAVFIGDPTTSSTRRQFLGFMEYGGSSSKDGYYYLSGSGTSAPDTAVKFQSFASTTIVSDIVSPL